MNISLLKKKSQTTQSIIRKIKGFFVLKKSCIHIISIGDYSLFIEIP